MNRRAISWYGWKRLAGAACALATVVAVNAAAAAADLPDPQAHLERVMANPNLHRLTGEFFAWQGAYSADTFLDAYEATQDPAWLEKARDYYSFYIDKLKTDPDGYKGWIGDHISRDPSIQADAIVGDAILLAPLLRLAELVRNDEKLHEAFGELAEEYIELARHIGWEKWNHRGTYYLDNGFGSYRSHHRYIDAEDPQRWVERPSWVVSENLNKHYAMGTVILRLYRLTGEEAYRQRVVEIYSRNRAMWRHFPEEDRVSWNFWMPHGPYDIEGRTPRSWVGVHPLQPSYQASEVARFVEVYDTGLVYDEQDMRRLANTNVWMRQEEGWRSSDGTSTAGTLWPSLARFDPRIRAMHEQAVGEQGISRAYLDNVTDRLGTARRYVTDEAQVHLADVPLQPGQYLSMTEVIPGTIQLARNQSAALATQTRAAGTLRIELLSADGAEVYGTIHEAVVGEEAAYEIPRWDGTHPGSGRKQVGDYLVRWSLAGEQRVAPVFVIEGEAADDEQHALTLRPGETIEIDFEHELDARWKLEGAAVSDVRARQGRHSLRLDARQSAMFTFSPDAGLPVRIRMWVYDAGEQRDGVVTGPAWGVLDGIGDTFAIRKAWRGFLDGNQFYAWVNTGENRWFNLHHARVPREEGWRQWVFDFRDPQNVSVTCDGQPVTTLTPQHAPQSAVAIVLLGGDPGTEPMYVDQITVEYPRQE